jgi:hypothetical protein
VWVIWCAPPPPPLPTTNYGSICDGRTKRYSLSKNPSPRRTTTPIGGRIPQTPSFLNYCAAWILDASGNLPWKSTVFPETLAKHMVQIKKSTHENTRFLERNQRKTKNSSRFLHLSCLHKSSTNQTARRLTTNSLATSESLCPSLSNSRAKQDRNLL